MSDRLKALREKRAAIVESMKAIVEKAEAEKRDLTADDAREHEKLFDQAEAARSQIQVLERQQETEREMAETRAAEEAREREARDSKGGGEKDKAPEAEARHAAFAKFLRGGFKALTDVEHRALSVASDADGGYVVAPQQFMASLIKFVDDSVFIRSKATTFRLEKAESLGVPSLDADVSDADWTTELATGGEDSSMKLGKREFRPHPVAKRIKISKTLMRISAIGIEQLVMQRLAYKFGVTQEKAFMTGNGQERPLGLFTASPNGISTARDISAGNTATSITFDGLMEAKFAVKGQYQRTGEWIFHRDAIKQISKLKDGEGQYLWNPSLTSAQPDMVLGRPINQSEFAPNTFTTGLYVGIFGDFKQYWIVDALDMTIQVLNELYAETNQIGFIGRMESDGMPVLGEAFARVKLG